MIKIGITGSLASGKSTVAKLMSKKKYPIFDADKVVTNLYKRNYFLIKIKKKFYFKNIKNIKKKVKDLIKTDKRALKQLELLIHPLVRKEMRIFMKKKKNAKIGIFEIPLLIESKLMKNFDVIIFIKARKRIRLKRFLSKNGNKKIFNLLDNKQLSEKKKIKYCDYVVVNENNIKILKRKLLTIIKDYE